METTISKSIRAADDRAGYDAACKRLLSEKTILAWILKDCVEEFRDCDVKDIAFRYIEGEPQVSEVPVAPDETNAAKAERTAIYDIRFLASVPSSGEKIRLIINVDGKNNFYPDYSLVKRSVCACSRMLSAQLGRELAAAGNSYTRKIYSIWVCLNPPKSRENTITSYSLTEKNLVGAVREPAENYDLMTAVMICLGKTGSDSGSDVLKLLDVLLSTETSAAEKQRILRDDFDIPMTQALERTVDVMCNLSKGVWEKGMEAGMKAGMETGMEAGMEAGMETGRKEGAEQAMRNSIKNLMETLGLTIEQAMSALRVSDADRPRYLDALSGQK